MEHMLKNFFIVGIMAIGISMLPQLQHHVSANEEDESDQLLNIAHRGASGHAPENTMAAFDRALDMNADFIEIDIHMSEDEEVVAIHDSTVDRTTDASGSVDEFTLNELKQLDAGSWFDSEFAGEEIPTLEEILDEYGGDIGILIEIKDPADYPGIEEKVANALEERNMEDPNDEEMIVQSFDHDSVEYFADLMPQVPLAVLVDNPEDISDERLSHFSAFADYTNPNHLMVTQNLVDRVHGQGMKMTPWTVNAQLRMEHLIDYGIDGIITDYPDRFNEAILDFPSTALIKASVERFDNEGAIEKNEDAVHSLELHLTAVSHYEDQEEADKVVQHMEKGFKDLLNRQQDNGLISEEAYSTLMSQTDDLIDKWR
ncbi:glycerophosphodiester phosphodiesterase [Salicibibacter kimchii]|uniref:Glycerophosphodiester phosphodiesterase n=1 Tax=Salicibibacter kimchii TaxID=2099786 RepID=A0A345BY63_9BACI|nr:glycerophosphodiester phosphodiesterase family protein [Salicibibacter kimchii]AXF55894.1 glycerophosphodiester phosphodiesterase [Salicibibacter kimchii]